MARAVADVWAKADMATKALAMMGLEERRETSAAHR